MITSLGLGHVRKAVTAAVGAAGSAYTAGMLDGGMDLGDWVTVVAFTLAVGYVTYKVPNKPAEPPK